MSILGFGTPSALGEWNLVWADEFEGETIDRNKWKFDLGNGPPAGWGNNELQFYTSRPQNAYVSNGVLHIVARQEPTNGFPYTSARLKTQGLFAKKYGRFEFRARLPQGPGFWPALWMMPQNSVYGGWAASGEIDVMESRGSDLTAVAGTIHYGGSWPNNVHSGTTYKLPDDGSTTNFHTYMVEWTTNSIKWHVDGQLYQTQTNWWSSGGEYPAPFDREYFLIMNLAVGGNYLGNPGSTSINTNSVFPGVMQVDYVRVYDHELTAKADDEKDSKPESGQ